jgi:hypothetical protein
MILDRLQRIRDRAYALWERAGGGHGQDEAHWHQASSEVDAEDVASTSRKKIAANGTGKAPLKERRPSAKQRTGAPAAGEKPGAKQAPKAKSGKAKDVSAAAKKTTPKAVSEPARSPSAGKPAKARSTRGAQRSTQA